MTAGWPEVATEVCQEFPAALCLHDAGPAGKKSIDFTLVILTWRGLRFGPLYRALCQRPSIFAVAKDRNGTGLTKATPATPK